eukprot:m.121008 g.121008  ORF g.121008 m.121008 type:complete len:106 (+) comp15625_c0_seq2:223-540(+)
MASETTVDKHHNKEGLTMLAAKLQWSLSPPLRLREHGRTKSMVGSTVFTVESSGSRPSYLPWCMHAVDRCIPPSQRFAKWKRTDNSNCSQLLLIQNRCDTPVALP